jgi:FMN phosphatase YigB (HAD superfamily)
MHLGDSHSRDFAGAKSAGWSALLYGKPVIEKEQIVSFPELLEYLP